MKHLKKVCLPPDGVSLTRDSESESIDVRRALRGWSLSGRFICVIVNPDSGAIAFTWLDGRASGWVYCDRDGLHVQQELLPSGLSEARHRHVRVAQFYFVLGGRGILELGDDLHVLRPGDGIEIPPGVAHKLGNRSPSPLEFLVISTGAPRLDREDLE